MSCTDSPPAQFPGLTSNSSEGASQPLEVLSTTASVPASEPVKLQLAAGEEQVILLGEPSEKDTTEVLALPRAVTARQH